MEISSSEKPDRHVALPGGESTARRLVDAMVAWLGAGLNDGSLVERAVDARRDTAPERKSGEREKIGGLR